MPFLHPAIFWGGLAAVAVPILIHLLNRSRFRIRDWAAMQFLLDSLRKNRRRLRIEELILLAVRCLVVLLLAAAVARFTGCAAMKLLPGGHAASRAVVFVLDDSYSMAQTYGAGTLFSVAAADLVERIEALPKTDRAAIVLTSAAGSGDAFFNLNFITDAGSLVARLRTLKPSDQRANLADALAAAKGILADKPESKRLYVLSDFRRIDLAGREQGEAIRKQFADLRNQGVEVLALDYGLEPRSNLTLSNIELLDRFVVARQSARIALEVRNNGPARAENVEVRLAARLKSGGEFRDVELPAQQIDSIDPGDSRRVEFALTCPEAGSAVVTARLPGDELGGDNTAWLALDVRAMIKVLVVDGRSDLADPAQSESYFFAHAIDPNRNASYGNRPDVITPEGLLTANFDEYDLVALLDVSDFPLQGVGGEGAEAYPQLTALADYVRRGGGLAIFTGDHVNLEFYNKRLYADGAGLAPFAIGPRKGQTTRQDTFYRLDPKSVTPEGVLRVFHGESAVMTDLIRFFAFTGAVETGPAAPSPQARPPRVLARFTDPDNSPAIVTRQYEKGTVVMFYSTASTAWNDWPTDPVGTYVVVMNDLCAYLARAQERGPAPRIGEAIVHELSQDQRDARALLKTPQYPAADVIARDGVVENDKRLVRFDQTMRAGIYSLTLMMPDGSHSEILTARNVDPAEGDLAPGHRGDLAAALGSDEFGYERRLGADTAAGIQAGTKKEYWIWALAAMLVLMALEIFLGQRFGHYPRA